MPLIDYKKSQSNFYNLISNAIAKNKISHAYLIETKELEENYRMIMDFAKMLVCPSHHFSYVSDCPICSNKIENLVNDICIIKPNGMWIKKEQLTLVQKKFSNVSISGQKQVYVVFDSHLMNKQAANSILKFLEEPVGDIVAIFVTNNINSIMPTIISRCQTISLNNLISESVINDDLIQLVKDIETKKLKILVEERKIIENFFVNRDMSLITIKSLIEYYENLLHNYHEDILKTKQITKKLLLLIRIQSKIKYNLNINLLFDKMILEMVGDYPWLDGQKY